MAMASWSGEDISISVDIVNNGHMPTDSGTLTLVVNHPS